MVFGLFLYIFFVFLEPNGINFEKKKLLYFRVHQGLLVLAVLMFVVAAPSLFWLFSLCCQCYKLNYVLLETKTGCQTISQNYNLGQFGRGSRERERDGVRENLEISEITFQTI